MFVCHGNICRSPMAEYIFKKMLSDRHLSSLFDVSSCATSNEEIRGSTGNPIYPPAKAELAAHGIPCHGKHAVQLQKADYDNYDLFVGMDGANIRNMHRIFGSDPDNKIRKLMDYTPRGGDVADPWYSERFDIAYRDIDEGCRAMLEQLLSIEK